MGTLADLKARIIAQTNRDDLSDDLASDLNRVIASAIGMFAAERWWFNELRATSTCAVGNVYQAIPAGARFIDNVWLMVGANRYALRKRGVAEIEALQSVAVSGQPTDFAVLGAQLYVWPAPNQAYPLIWELVADVAPVLDFTADPATQSNEWTNSGADLIVAQSKILLYRDYLSAMAGDPRLALAQGQVSDAYSQLKSETTRRLSAGRVRPSW